MVDVHRLAVGHAARIRRSALCPCSPGQNARQVRGRRLDLHDGPADAPGREKSARTYWFVHNDKRAERNSVSKSRPAGGTYCEPLR